MDERFEKVRQVPPSALKQISAGRLRGKSDINPQWKIEAMTEVYGVCGEGWYHELVEDKVIPMDDGQIMLFMKVNVYIRDREGNWSKPIQGFGGDYIAKKESGGIHLNDEAYKMCYTDALGNALKSLGIANDVYRGFWDGSKYNRPTEAPADAPAFKREDGRIYVLSRNGNYYELSLLPLETLNNLSNDQKYAAIQSEIRAVMVSRG